MPLPLLSPPVSVSLPPWAEPDMLGVAEKVVVKRAAAAVIAGGQLIVAALGGAGHLNGVAVKDVDPTAAAAAVVAAGQRVVAAFGGVGHGPARRRKGSEKSRRYRCCRRRSGCRCRPGRRRTWSPRRRQGSWKQGYRCCCRRQSGCRCRLWRSR